MKKTKQRIKNKKDRQDEKAKDSLIVSAVKSPAAQPQTGREDWGNLQHMGNRTLLRLAQSGRLEGELPIRHLNPEQLRQAVLTQAAQKAGLAPSVQKQDEEPVEAGPTLSSTGTVTIEDPVVNEYEVSGASLREVFDQLDPEEWGRCRWIVDYSYDTTGGRVSSVNITLHLTIRMPRWGEGYDGASQAAKNEWQRMIRALRAHEDHHADIARRWAPIFKERILGQRAGNAANRYQQTLNEMEREQRQYDSTSQHGQNEGVSLDTTIR